MLGGWIGCLCGCVGMWVCISVQRSVETRSWCQEVFLSTKFWHEVFPWTVVYCFDQTGRSLAGWFACVLPCLDFDIGLGIWTQAIMLHSKCSYPLSGWSRCLSSCINEILVDIYFIVSQWSLCASSIKTTVDIILKSLTLGILVTHCYMYTKPIWASEYSGMDCGPGLWKGHGWAVYFCIHGMGRVLGLYSSSFSLPSCLTPLCSSSSLLPHSVCPSGLQPGLLLPELSEVAPGLRCSGLLEERMGLPAVTVSTFPGSRQTQGEPQLQGIAEYTLSIDGGVPVLPVGDLCDSNENSL